jgi:hypothetical protein
MAEPFIDGKKAYTIKNVNDKYFPGEIKRLHC